MFTGCIKQTGILRSRETSGANGSLQIATKLAKNVAVGESIAVNGVCLTVEGFDLSNSSIGFHTLATTLDKTNLGLLTVGSKVNLEESLCIGDRLDGHLVTGHVDCVASVLSINRERDDFVIEIQLSEKIKPLIVEHGSIAVDGISLTVASLNEKSFTVHIIPYTLDNTNLREITVHTLVNLEMDMIGKYVARSQSLIHAQPT